jgi:hypothetical protein
MPGASTRRLPGEPKGPPEAKYFVRASNSNNRDHWVTVGIAFERDGEDGITVKLNTLSLGS